MSPLSGTNRGQRPIVGVLVVDDQPAFRRAARAVIDATAGFEPLADAASGPDALRYANELKPDLVLMDVNMPGMDGFETARRLTTSHPGSVVVLVSLEDLDKLSEEPTSCGAVAFVRKQDLRPTMLAGLWRDHGRPG